MSESRLSQLKEFQQKTPNDPFILYAIATEYLKLNDKEQALSYFELLVRDHQRYIGTYYHLGKLYEKLDLQEKASKTYQMGIEIAQQTKNMHALAELQAVYNSLMGIEPDDDYD